MVALTSAGVSVSLGAEELFHWLVVMLQGQVDFLVVVRQAVEVKHVQAGLGMRRCA